MNMWYYGVQYGKKANPKNLWSTYFTSSDRVKAFREVNGEPDVIQIRQTFSCQLKAKQWEDRVIGKMLKQNKMVWLNRCSTFSGFIVDDIAAQKISETLKGRKVPPETLAKRKSRKGIKLSPEVVMKISSSNTGKKRSIETIRKLRESHKNMKPSENTRIKFIEAITGKPKTEEHKTKLRNSRLKTETRKKILFSDFMKSSYD